MIFIFIYIFVFIYKNDLAFFEHIQKYGKCFFSGVIEERFLPTKIALNASQFQTKLHLNRISANENANNDYLSPIFAKIPFVFVF